MKLKKSDNYINQFSKLINSNSNLRENTDFLERYKHSVEFGHKNNEKLTSYIMLNIMNSRIFTARTKTALISQYSRLLDNEGQLTPLIKEVFEYLHAKNIPVANVMFKNAKQLRNFGFVNTIKQKQYTFSIQNLKDTQKDLGGSTRDGSWSDLMVQNGAAQLYEVPMHTTDERNTINRPYWYWNLLQEINPERKLVVYTGRVGLPEAYMFYTSNSNEIYINEFYAMNKEGYVGLLNYLEKIGNENTKFVLTLPKINHLNDYISNWASVKEEEIINSCSRIINIQQVLSDLKFSKKIHLIIEVKDDNLCPWNNGKYEITYDQTLKVCRTNKTTNLIGDITDWTEIFLGENKISNTLKGEKAEDNILKKGTVSFFEEY